jgi:fructokinase
LLTRADVVKVSEDDLAFIVPGESADDAARSLLNHGPMVILLTRGSEPATAITAAGRVEVPVPQVRVADTIGAGDSLGGAFVAWWMHRGLSRPQVADMRLLHEGLGFATAVATVTCQRVGADPPRLADLDAAARDSWSAV